MEGGVGSDASFPSSLRPALHFPADAPRIWQLAEPAHPPFIHRRRNTPPCTSPLCAQEEEEYDPLDAFMAEVNAEVAASKPTHRDKPSAGLACDERVDGAADYMAVRGRRGRGPES